MTSGTADKAKGRMKKAAGELLDNDRLRDEGRADEAAGKVKDGVERAVDAVKNAVRPRKA